MKTHPKLPIMFIVAVGLMVAACAPKGTQPPVSATEVTNNTPAAAETLPAGVLFTVVKTDGSAVPFTLDDLKKLPLGQLGVEGKMEEGPKIADVLLTAGVKDYQSIHLEGSSSPADLTKVQVDEGAILDFNNHGTVKLSSLAIPKANWTKDVSKIEVR